MKQRKQELGYSNKTIAGKTGLPISTVQKVFSGATSSPRESTVKALENLLKPDPSLSYEDAARRSSSASLISEKALDYQERGDRLADGETGPYRLRDYYALPDEQRAELIDGFIYDMTAPGVAHQSIAGYIFKVLLDHVLSHGGSCHPFISPLDVQLDKDDKTMIQPDVIVVCDPDQIRTDRVFGAPDLVIEVLSSSTRKKDMSLKMKKYIEAGVREYWMIDPVKKAVVQYDLEHLDIPAVYGFDAKIPVLIWDGACEVDLKEMSEALSFLWTGA